MANEQNLIPQNKRTKAEQRIIAQKGGIASGKARRERKTLAQIGEMIGGLDIKSPKNRAILRQAGIDEDDMINDVGMMFRLNLRAQNGDPKAIELISRLRGQFKEHIETIDLTPPKPLSPRKQKK